jgi:hypothetical protein
MRYVNVAGKQQSGGAEDRERGAPARTRRFHDGFRT